MFSGIDLGGIQLGCHMSTFVHYGATPWSRPGAHIRVVSGLVCTL